MGSRRAGRAGRGESRRILRVQARVAGRSRGDHPAQPRVEGLPHGLRGGTRSRPLGRGRGGRSKRPRALLHRRQGHPRARSPGTRHRVALRLPDGHRVGQGWRDRRDLRAAGAARNRAKPRRPLHPAIHAEAAIEGARPGPRDRAANRLRAGARRVRRPRDVAHPAGRRHRLRHDGSRLGTGHEARSGNRHEPRRPDLPRGDHRKGTRHSGSSRLRRRDPEDPRRRARHRLLCRGRHGRHIRGAARLRAAANRARRAARRPRSAS